MAALQQNGVDITVVEEIDLELVTASFQAFSTLSGKTVVPITYQESTGVVQEVSKESWE